MRCLEIGEGGKLERGNGKASVCFRGTETGGREGGWERRVGMRFKDEKEGVFKGSAIFLVKSELISTSLFPLVDAIEFLYPTRVTFFFSFLRIIISYISIYKKKCPAG